MDSPPAYGFKELFTHVIGDMARAVCERNGETRDQQVVRSQATVHTIMGFLPRDVIEAMLAGHCVMFHELMLDSVRDTLRGEMDTLRRSTRNNIVAMDKAFGNNLARLERYQNRPSEGRRDARETQPVSAADPVDAQPDAEAHAERIGQAATRPESSAARTPAAPPTKTGLVHPARRNEPSARPLTKAAIVFTPSPEAVAACRANPEAMDALNAGDADRFARAMGIDLPGPAYLAAASHQTGIFVRQAPDLHPPRATATLSAGRANGIADGD